MRTVTVRVAGIGVYVVDIREGKSEGTIVPVHSMKAYVRVEKRAFLLHGTKSRVVTRLLTGHNTLIRQLLLMGLTNILYVGGAEQRMNFSPYSVQV